MSHELRRLGINYGVPGRPYRAPSPGYSYYRVVPVYAFTAPTNAAWVVTGVFSYQVGTKPELVYVPPDPGDPGVPAQRADIPPRGWTSFGRSIAGTLPGGEFRFTPGKPAVGIAIGPTPNVASPASGYTHIRHGLHFTGGEVRSLRTGAFYGTYFGGDEFTVRTGPSVVFLRNGVPIGSEANTFAPGETLYLGAALYAAGDSVDDPAIVAFFTGTSAANMPTITASSADTAHAESLAMLPPLVAESGVLARSLAVFPGLVGASSQTSFAQSMGTFPALEATSYGGSLAIVPMNTSSVLFAPLAAASLLLVGETGTAEGDLAPLWGMSSDRPYGESHASFGPLVALTSSMEAGFCGGPDFFFFGVPLVTLTINTVDARDSFTFDIPMASTPTANVDARDSFQITVAVSAVGDTLVDARDVFWFDVPLMVADDEGDCWAVNLDGFGSTTYSGYQFNSFANIGGRYFGAAASGVHELEGDSDAGAPIRAIVDFGLQDFGTSLKKTVSEVYLGMSGAGHLYVKILAEGQEYVYKSRSYSEHMQQQRVTLGKGLRPNYAGLQIFNEGGADFALDSVEFVPVTMSRRI